VSAGLSLPLFGTRRLIVVRGAGELPAKAVDRLRAAIEEARRQPGGWPTDGTTVVLLAGGADRRAPALRLLPEADQVEVRTPSGRAVFGWLQERARAAGLTLVPQAAQTLVALVGEDLGRLASEVEKAAIYAGDDGQISEEVVRALAGETRVRQYWELTQALEAGQRVEALRLLERLLEGGEEPVVLLACVVGYVRDLWRVMAGLAESADGRQAGRFLQRRRPDFAVERLAVRARAVGLEGVRAAIRRGFEVERALKTSAGSPRVLLTLLVAELTR
jgi:DNA polymerase-3 subunit delta